MKNLKSLNKYLIRYKYRLFLGVVFICLSNFFGVYSPQVIRHAIDLVTYQIEIYRVFSGEHTGAAFLKIFSSTIIFFAGLLIALALIRGFFVFLMRQTIIVMSRLIEYDQKNEIFDHYQKLHLNFFKQNNTGDLMSRITEDVSRVRMYTGPAIMYTVNLMVLFIMVIYTMIRVNPELTLYTVLPLPLLGFSIFYVNGIIESKSEMIQKQLAAISTISQESYSGIRVIKSYVQEKFINRYFAGEAEKYKSKTLDLAKLEAVYFPIILMLVGLSTILTIFFGGMQVINGKITAGNIAEFVIYINMLTWPIASVGWVLALVQRASASQKRINEFLHTPSEIVSSSNDVAMVNGSVQFRDVSFTYPDSCIEALKNISFEIKQGEKMAIIGKTGSGKSTIAQLMVRMFDVSNGDIRIDSRNIKEINLSSLRSQIGYVPQDVFLFSDSIENNIAFGFSSDQVEHDDVVKAAQHASVLKDIEALPQDFKTVIGERGITLSGGQKQRISIARALIKNPFILIFDDCLSAVDAQTEKDILTHLNEVLKSKTAIIITHRIFALMEFDNILVLDNGRIVEQGTHEMLMQKKSAYFELFEKQQIEESNLTV